MRWYGVRSTRASRAYTHKVFSFFKSPSRAGISPSREFPWRSLSARTMSVYLLSQAITYCLHVIQPVLTYWTACFGFGFGSSLQISQLIPVPFSRQGTHWATEILWAQLPATTTTKLLVNIWLYQVPTKARYQLTVIRNTWKVCIWVAACRGRLHLNMVRP